MKPIALWGLISGLTPIDVLESNRDVAGATWRLRRKVIPAAALALACVLAVLAGSAVQAGGLRGGVVNDASVTGR